MPLICFFISHVLLNFFTLRSSIFTPLTNRILQVFTVQSSVMEIEIGCAWCIYQLVSMNCLYYISSIDHLDTLDSKYYVSSFVFVTYSHVRIKSHKHHYQDRCFKPRSLDLLRFHAWISGCSSAPWNICRIKSGAKGRGWRERDSVCRWTREKYVHFLEILILDSQRVPWHKKIWASVLQDLELCKIQMK